MTVLPTTPFSCFKIGMVSFYLQAFDPRKRPSASEVSIAVLKMIDHENPETFRCHESHLKLFLVDGFAGLTWIQHLDYRNA
jgi:hypothetical protein